MPYCNGGIRNRKLLWMGLIALLFGLFPLSAQSLDGTWIDARFNVKLILESDGTYALSHAQGGSRGRWAANGQLFQLQDMSGSVPVNYTIMQFSAGDLVLQDSQGNRFHFKRQTGPYGGQGAKTLSDRVLANEQGFELRESHFRAAVDLIQFVIGGKIKPTELTELKTTLISEFPQNPSFVVGQLTQIGQSMSIIHQATDALRIGLARQQIFAELYMATTQMPAEQKPLIVSIMNRYIKVLSVDAQNKLLLTDRDVNGMIEYLVFVNGLMGRPVSLTPSLRKSVEADLMSRFNTLPLPAKQILCSASLTWALTRNNWDQLTVSQKAQYGEQFRAQLGQSLLSSPSADFPSAPPKGSSRSLGEQMREFQARQNMMTMMYNMNVNSHALSTNIIENIGGTGNYWEVVDY